jgi:hypothetical protein
MFYKGLTKIVSGCKKINAANVYVAISFFCSVRPTTNLSVFMLIKQTLHPSDSSAVCRESVIRNLLVAIKSRNDVPDPESDFYCKHFDW